MSGSATKHVYLQGAAAIALVLYGVYGFLSGEIYQLPGRRNYPRELLVVGDGVIFAAMSYLAFAAVFVFWALPRMKSPFPKNIWLRNINRFLMLLFALIGFTLQATASLMRYL